MWINVVRYPDACLIQKAKGTLASTTDLGRGILEMFFSRMHGKVLAVYKNMHGDLQTIYWDGEYFPCESTGLIVQCRISNSIQWIRF
jgi:hypothetical protein